MSIFTFAKLLSTYYEHRMRETNSLILRKYAHDNVVWVVVMSNDKIALPTHSEKDGQVCILGGPMTFVLS